MDCTGAVLEQTAGCSVNGGEHSTYKQSVRVTCGVQLMTGTTWWNLVCQFRPNEHGEEDGWISVKWADRIEVDRKGDAGRLPDRLVSRACSLSCSTFCWLHNHSFKNKMRFAKKNWTWREKMRYETGEYYTVRKFKETSGACGTSGG